MMTKLLILFAGITFAGAAFAQQPSTGVPTARPPSEKAISFVRRQALPGNPVMISEKVEVGHAIPNNIVLSPVPEEPYAFAVVNQQRLIIDPKTYVIVEIVD